MSRLPRFWAGTLLGGLFGACAEVLLLVSHTELPIELLRAKARSPITDFWSVAAVAGVTDAALGLAAGLILGLLLSPLLARLSRNGALAAGIFLGAMTVSSMVVVLWVAWLHNASWNEPQVLADMAIGLFAAAGFWALLAWLATKSTKPHRLWINALAIPALMLSAANAYHRHHDTDPPTRKGQARAGLPNIIFITIDTLRADQLGSYGGPVKTPFLDRLAREGVRFEHPISQITWTTPSHVSMFSGLYPIEHGASNGVPMRSGVQTLPDWLRGQGYHTAAFTSAFTTRSKVMGFRESFDVYIDAANRHLPTLTSGDFGELTLYRLIDYLSESIAAAPIVISRIESWLSREPERPLFLWAHFFDVHSPHLPEPEFREMYLQPDMPPEQELLALYRAELTQLDRDLEGLFRSFEEHGVLEDAIVVVTSDHGEDFWEPHPSEAGGATDYHGKHVWEPTIRVPLIFWSPSRIASGHVVETQVESIDITPTLMDLIEAEIPVPISGQSFVARLHSGESEEASEEFAFSENQFTAVDGRWFSVRTREWKFLLHPEDATEVLFDLTSDAGETTNVISEHPEVAAEFREALQGTRHLEEVELAPLLPGAREALRALGYVVD